MHFSAIHWVRELFGISLLAYAISATTVWLSIRYAYARRLLDQPGRRRSHAIATPRGGGLGIVIAAVVCFCVPLLMMDSYPAGLRLGSLVALFAVAGIGGWDDHRPLSAVLRFSVHLLAAGLIALPLLVGLGASMGWLSAVVWAMVMLATVWSINLHNFMDGINGLLACQAIFVFSVFAIQCAHMEQPALAMLLLGLVAGALGFLPFNFPRARIFMGDIGSGSLGLLIALSAWLGLASHAFDIPFALITCSAFVMDATGTLLMRLLGGRRWYTAHREHLYQWLVRRGFSHTAVVAMYMGWNVLIVVPALFVLHAAAPLSALRASMAAVTVYGMAIGIWLLARRWCLRKL